MNGDPTAPAAAGVAPLSPREAEILTLAAQGLTDTQIARRVQLRGPTVSSHLHRLRRKLDAANRAHAVAIGLYLGLITLTHPVQPATPARSGAVIVLDEHARLAEDSDTMRLWRLLTDAGPLGANPAILAGQLRRSRPWVYYYLRDWTQAGWAEQIGRGRWRAVAPARFEHGRVG